MLKHELLSIKRGKMYRFLINGIIWILEIFLCANCFLHEQLCQNFWRHRHEKIKI